ncbi:reverse transcriptase [Cucumis melo var. makuwa]|uniref:Reverse transcriptase n=1 Tax=Cucumis melo var. makuwa TaxID=1194695 RepID=A0A5A7ULN4_CUCMM|nr:reverse transcriptase [Cucumis melo var. makuwa]
MLADRLKLTLLETIVEIQLAFVKGRQITDAILMEHEIVDYWKLKKTKGFVLKLDIEKSFDTINWEFIDFMLMKKNYPEKWRNWIKASVMSVQYSVFINDKPCGRIKPNRGIRQGDPISPFIFILATDYLSSLLFFLQDKKAIKGVEINGTTFLFLPKMMISQLAISKWPFRYLKKLQALELIAKIRRFLP